MKKRCHVIIFTIIILASFFISCGIPNYFYLDDDDYTFTSENNDDKNEITAMLEISDAEQLEQLDYGISMVYFYYLSDEPTISTSSLESKFETKFRGPIGIGIIGGPSDLTVDDESYDLYAFNFEAEDLVSPYYHDLIELQNDETTSYETTIYADFSFTLEEDTSGLNKVIYKRFDDNDISVTNNSLVRYNKNGNFLSSNSILSDSDSDYSQFSGKQPGSYYIHIFTSFTAQEGDFTNRWWSELKYLGSLKIT